MVELLCAALGGAALAFEADSFFAETGNRPRLGQALLAVVPTALVGLDAFGERVETLISAMLEDDAVRLPGSRREFLRAKAITEGIEVAPALLEQLRALGR